MKSASRPVGTCVMLAVLAGAEPSQAAEPMRATLTAVNVMDWEFAEGRGVEAFLVLDNGWEVRFAHPLVAALPAGLTVALELSPTHGLDRALPVVCRLETPGTVLHALPSPECPRSVRP